MVKGRPSEIYDTDLKNDFQAAISDALALLPDNDMAITMGHSQFHSNAGNSHELTHEFDSISAGASVNIVMEVPAGLDPHIIQKQWTPSSQNTRLEFYRSPNTNSDGTAPDSITNLKDGDSATQMTFRVDDTINDAGTLLGIFGTSGGREGSAVSSVSGEELELQEGTTYMMQATNLSGSSAIEYLWVDMLWYEL